MCMKFDFQGFGENACSVQFWFEIKEKAAQKKQAQDQEAQFEELSKKYGNDTESLVQMTKDKKIIATSDKKAWLNKYEEDL